METKKLVVLLFLLASVKVLSQENVVAAGDNITSINGSVAFSVGQVVYITNADINGSVAQGLQQPYEISIVMGVENTGINVGIQAYPNPADDYLTLNVGNYKISNLKFQLFDFNGRLVENKKISTAVEVINVQKLEAAVYFLKVIRNNKEIKNFKIIKK